MEYQVTEVRTYWVRAESKEEALLEVRAGLATPDSVDYEV